MAEKRMFAKTIIDSDAFLEMPQSTQLLYFHLSMHADDDGFVNSPKKIMRTVGCKDDDLKVLIAKSFIIPFESGLIVIKHWRINNIIRSDRYKPTEYIEEKRLLGVKENGAYTLNNTIGIPQDNQNGYQRLPQIRLDKVRLDKDRLDKDIADAKTTKFIPPSILEISTYCKERNNSINAEAFKDYYDSKGWMIGKNKMKDWKAAIRTWERNCKETKPKGRVYE